MATEETLSSLNGTVEDASIVSCNVSTPNIFSSTSVAKAPKVMENSRWYHLGLSTSSSPALKSLLKQSRATIVDSTHQSEPPFQSDELIHSAGQFLLAKNICDTFLSFKWMLQVLVQGSWSLQPWVGSKPEILRVKIADILLFENGDPKYWICSAEDGRVQARSFLSTPASWERFLKTARHSSGISKGEFSLPVCIKYSLSVEGVVGEHINVKQLRELAKTEAVDRFQMVGLQILIRAKCGSTVCRKSIVYKTHTTRNPMSRVVTVKHTKEYDMFESKWDVHMSNHRGPDGADDFDLRQNVGEAAAPPQASSKRRYTITSKSLNRPTLEEFTVRTMQQIHRLSGLELRSLRLHFVVDVEERIWLVGASKIIPLNSQVKSGDALCESEVKPSRESQVTAKEIEQHAARVSFQDCLSALTTPVPERKSSLVQAVFDFTRTSHFVSSIPPGVYFRLCHSMEYKHVEKGMEIYYAGDLCDEMYIVLAGSVRALLEPQNDMYCRTVDLTDKDAFGEQCITKPGTKMQSQAIAVEDTHLIVIKRHAVDQILDRGKSNPDRWKLKKPQLVRCRKIFSTEPRARTELDVKTGVSCTHSIYFFQNISFRIHYDLCSVAQYRRFEKHENLFDRPCMDQKSSDKATWAFYIIIAGLVRWEYVDRMGNPIQLDVSEAGHVLSVGKCFSTESVCEVLIVLLGDWEKFVNGRFAQAIPGSEIDSDEKGYAPSTTYSYQTPQIQSQSHKSHTNTFITQVDAQDRIGANDISTSQLFDVPLLVIRPPKQLKLKDSKEKQITCAVTGDKFPASQRKFLRWTQIRSVAEHLEKRQTQMRGFDRERWSRDPPSKLMLLDNLAVSPFAYSVYISEKNMEDQERVFAALVLNGTAPRVSQRVLPPAGCSQITTNLLLYAMFLEVVDIESPECLCRIGCEYELRFSLCEQVTNITFAADNTESRQQMIQENMKIDQVRVSWFFCSDEGVSMYLKQRNIIELTLIEVSTSTEIAKGTIDLATLGNKVALHQSFRAKLNPTSQDTAQKTMLEFVFLNLNFGCIRYREVDVSDFRLRRRHGLFLPSHPFITESLPPEGWDPCNEVYIKKILKDGKYIVDPVLSMNGTLITASTTTALHQGEQPTPEDTLSHLHKFAFGESVERILPGSHISYSDNKKGTRTCALYHDGEPFSRESIRISRPASAMGRLMQSHVSIDSKESKQHPLTTLVGAMTRPASALARSDGLDTTPDVKHVSKLRLTCQISSLMGKSRKEQTGLDIIYGLEMAQDSWHSTLIPLQGLDANLKALDHRMVLVEADGRH